MLTALYLNILMIFAIMLIAIICLAKYEFRQQRVFDTRARLLKRVYSLRISKMMEFLGADVKNYIKKIPPQEIAQHIRICQSCKNTPTCDSCLRDGKLIGNMNFCPNFKSLIKHSKTLYEKR